MAETVTFGARPGGVAYADRPAAYAVVAGENGTVAAVKGTSGKFFLPGGGSLPGEPAEETVRREVREELARSVRLIRPIGAATQYFYAADDDRHYKMSVVFFLAEFHDGPAGRGEHDLSWLSPAEAETAFFHESHAWAVRRGLKAGEAETGMTLIVRPELVADHAAIRNVNRLAFGQDDEARLVDALRDGGFLRVSLVAEQAGRVVGHILFSDLSILTDNGIVPALSLAPMTVLPECQQRGIGSALVQKGLETCRGAGHRIVVVLGHPHFYPRFGFSAKLAEPLSSPFAGREAWMALELVSGSLDGVTGWVRYPPPFGAGGQVRPVYRPDRAEWVRMRTALWPDGGEDEHGDEVEAFFVTDTFRWSESFLSWKVLVAERPAGGLCGFIEASIRPHVDGCSTRPVGYVEGWYVDPDVRRQGVGRRLAEAAERWAAAQGCQEMASDAHLGNTVSHEAHKALGFGESERLVHFRKRLGGSHGEAAGHSFATPRLKLLGVAGSFAVCKLPTGPPLPPWATAGDLFSVTRTADELSVVCRQEAVPGGVLCERGWRCLRVAGSMPFTLVGVLASLTVPVAKAGVGVFAFSTFDTDYLLVKALDMPKAAAALRAAGHLVDAEGVVP